MLNAVRAAEAEKTLLTIKESTLPMDCSFYFNKKNEYICTIKRGEISYEVYKEYCKNDYSKKCPIYQYYLKEGKL